MTKFNILAISALIASSVSSAWAESQWSLGAAAMVGSSPYKQYTNRVYPVPIISYEGESFYFRGLSAGYYLWNDDADKLSVMALYSPLRFKPKDSDSKQMRHLDSRKSTLMAGLSYEHYTQYGFLRTALAGDTLDNSNGIVWDTAWLYRYNNDKLTLTPGLGVTWSSDNQNEYYYGVSKSESRNSGMRSYDPDSSWSPYAELSVNYQLTDSWNIYGMGRYVRLSHEVTDSPMIDKKWTGMLLTGVTYKF